MKTRSVEDSTAKRRPSLNLDLATRGQLLAGPKVPIEARRRDADVRFD